MTSDLGGLIDKIITNAPDALLVVAQIIPLHRLHPSTMLGSDDIHPNTTGYQFMADHWYAAIGSLLP